MILVDPQPRTLAMICDPPTRARLEGLGRLVVSDAEDDLLTQASDRFHPVTGLAAMPQLLRNRTRS